MSDPVSSHHAFTPDKRSAEHGSWIVEALETGRTYRGHFNVINQGTITNLPDDAVMEAPVTKVYRVVVTDGKVVLVDPTTMRVVDVIDR